MNQRVPRVAGRAIEMILGTRVGLGHLNHCHKGCGARSAKEGGAQEKKVVQKIV